MLNIKHSCGLFLYHWGGRQETKIPKQELCLFHNLKLRNKWGQDLIRVSWIVEVFSFLVLVKCGWDSSDTASSTLGLWQRLSQDCTLESVLHLHFLLLSELSYFDALVGSKLSVFGHFVLIWHFPPIPKYLLLNNKSISPQNWSRFLKHFFIGPLEWMFIYWLFHYVLNFVLYQLFDCTR